MTAHHARLRLLLLAIAVLCALTSAASAQGQGSGQGNSGQGQGNQGQGNQGSGNRGQGNQGAGNGNGLQLPPGDEGLALEAVRSRRALPLEDILATARRTVPGKVIDARLVTLRGLLVYEVKALAQDGRVSRTYYYARSGRQVGSD